MTGICGHIPGVTCSNCAPQWASIAPWSSLPPDALGRIADALERLVDALTCDRYAANEARQRAEASLSLTPSTDATVSDSEPDPLDENDHRDRVLPGGRRLVRNGPGHWHTATCGRGPWCSSPTCRLSLLDWHLDSGPLTFAPDAAQQTPSTATSADEGTEAQESAPEADGPKLNAQTGMEPILCPECGHDIDRHVPGLGCLDPGPRPCTLRPSDVARELIEQAVAQATGADQHVTLPDGWELVDGHDVRRVGWEPGWREGLVVRDHRRWYALSASTNDWRVCATKQAAVDWTIQQAGGGHG